MSGPVLPGGWLPYHESNVTRVVKADVNLCGLFPASSSSCSYLIMVRYPIHLEIAPPLWR